jgi:hypothetical protein
MLKSFYNPDEREALNYHQGLLKLAEQERLARQCMQATQPQHESPQARTSLAERFLHLFNFKANHSAFALKDHKQPR